MNVTPTQSLGVVRGKRCVFTICTKSYIGLAETLGSSIRDNGATVDYFIVVVDDDTRSLQSTVASLLSAEDLCGFTAEEWTAQTFKYELVEFCTSIKARCFQRLLEKGYDNIVYFDPDILVFDDLEWIFRVLQTHEVAVTPHRLDINHNIPSRGGIFNLGFLAVRNSRTICNMLQWWHERLMNFAISDAARGYFTDQKWMDNLPLVIPTDLMAVLDHPGMNLAPWNLHERELKRQDDRTLVRLRAIPDEWYPLSFVHYSSLNYGELARGHFGARAKELCDKNSGFEHLVTRFMMRLQDSRFSKFQGVPYKFATYSNGSPIHPGHRRMFARLDTELTPPRNPFDSRGEFYHILKAKGMLVKSSPNSGPSVTRASQRVRLITKGLDLLSKAVIRIFGYEFFFLSSKFLTRYLHPINHARLLDSKEANRDVEYF